MVEDLDDLWFEGDEGVWDDGCQGVGTIDGGLPRGPVTVGSVLDQVRDELRGVIFEMDLSRDDQTDQRLNHLSLGFASLR